MGPCLRSKGIRFKQNIINLYKQGESAAQLAREYGIGYSTV
ncbi:helix-turn-helix domain-containing protein, partial [Levilactobacillus brevis]|nr:helix-turn-helix domain-containing protein [Levilactobacillus brevis]